MDSSIALFRLMAHLSQLHEGEKIIQNFVEGINAIFSPVEFIMTSKGKSDKHTYEIRTKKSHFGFIRIKNSILSQEQDEILLDNAAQMLAVFLERRNIERRFQKEKDSLEKVAEKRLSELSNTVKELRSARYASMNLIEDLTEEIEKRTRYEEGIRESEEKYRNLFENHVAVKIIIDPDTGNIADANKSAAAFYGWDIDQLKQMNLSQINILPEEELRNEIQKARNSRNFNFEFKHRKADGTIVDVDVFSSSILIGGKKYLHSIIHDVTEKKMAERALRASERNYRSLIDGMTETIWVIDFNGHLVDVNKAATELLGYSKEELFSIGLNGIDASLSAEEIIALTHSIPKDRLQIFETSHKSKDGTIYPVEIYSSVVKYQGKESILSIARDISRRKEMEKQIRENEETIRLLFDSTAEGIYGIDLEGNCTFCNQAAKRMLGFTDESEIVGRNTHHLIHHTNSDGSIHPAEECEIINTLKQSLGTHADDDVFWKKNGTCFPVEYWSYPIKREGRLTGSVVTFIDITQRKRDIIIQDILYKIARTSMTSRAIRDIILVVRQELSKVFDIDHFYLALYKPETDTLERIVYMNESPELKEWKAENSLAGFVIKTGQSLQLKKEELKRFITENAVEYTGAIAECWLGVPLMDDKEAIGVIVVQSYSDSLAYEGSVHLLEMIAHELTVVIHRNTMVQDLIIAKEKAEESDRLKSAFLANMSHEIRTPMNGILGFLELLNEPSIDEENRKEYISIVNKSGQRLLDTINDIIEISKIEAGIVEITKKEIDAAERMKFFFNFFKPQAFLKGIQLEISEQVTGAAAIIETDSSKLDAILTNLIKNAIKFTTHGCIQIGNYHDDGSLVFYVKDTGKGIHPDRLEAIFERFVQGDINLTRAHEGSGLGLSIAKAYVDALGGKIWVQSEVGEGSIFYFSVPYKSGNYKKVILKSNEVPVSVKDSFIILVAEDDEISFKYIKALLSRENITVLRTVNGQDTVKVVESDNEISLILMDIKMPGMDGLQATQQIRKFNPVIPIIAQSAYALSGDDAKAREAGCNDYLTKPINRTALMGMINKHAKKHPSKSRIIKVPSQDAS